MAKRSKNTPIRVGLVGIGRAGWSMHRGELAPRKKKFIFTAACDTDNPRAERMAEEYGCTAYTKIEDLIADPNVDLVDIASRSPEHVPHACLALKAGKDVFLEKPIALTYAEAKKLKAAEAKSKGKLYIRHNRRFESGFQHIREIIASGILGDVYEIKLRRVGYQRRDDWQTIIDCGGGQLLNWGPHIIDHGLRFLESPLVELWSDLKKVAAVGDAEDHLKIIMKGKNGRLIDLEISGGMALPEPEYLVMGSRGALSSSGENIHLRYLDPKQKLKPCKAKVESPSMEGGFGNAEPLKWIEKDIKVNPKLKVDTTSIWDYLYASIREGKRFPITLDEALQVMEVVSACKKGTTFEAKKTTAKKTKKK